MHLNQRQNHQPGGLPARFVSVNTLHKILLAFTAILMAVQALLIAPVPALAGPTPPPQTSPQIQRYADWAAKPMRPAPGSDTTIPTLSPDGAAVPTASIEPSTVTGEGDDNFVIEFFEMGYGSWDIAIYFDTGFYPSGQPLASSPADDYYPRLSYDLKKVVFVSERDGNPEIYCVNTDNTGLVRLTHHAGIDTRPAFSPDGSKVVFVSDRSGNPEIWLMNSDGTGAFQVTNDPAVDIDPNWSPDGTSITWVRRSSDSVGSIYIMGADGSNQHFLYGPLAYPANPVWAPSGDRIGLQADVNGDGWWDMLQFRVDGRGAQVFPIGKDGAYDFLFGGWSGTGSYLLFVEEYYEQTREGWYLSSSNCKKYFVDVGSYSRLDIPANYFSSADLRGTAETVPPPPEPLPAPKSWIDPLPEWSQGSQIPITFHIQLGGSDLNVQRISIEYSSDPFTGTWYESIFYGYNFDSRIGNQVNGSTTLLRISEQFPAENTVYLRIKALDSQDIWEPTHAMPDTTTKLYDHQISGQILDMRGYPISHAEAHPSASSSGLTPTDLQGQTHGYMLHNEVGAITFGKDGFGVNPAQNWPGTNASQFLAVLPPNENLLQNGQFEDLENLTAGWKQAGSLPVQGGKGYSGWGAATMGLLTLGNPVPTTPQPINALFQTKLLSTAAGPDGALHVLVRYQPDQSLLIYAMRAADGSWSAPEIAFGNSFITKVGDLQIGPNGSVGFLVTTGSEASDSALFYVYRVSTGGWAVEKVAEGIGLDSKVDGTGKVHVLYARSEVAGGTTFFYAMYTSRMPDGHWNWPVQVYAPANSYDYQMLTHEKSAWLAITRDGSVHIVGNAPYFKSQYSEIIYSRLLPSGALTDAEKAPILGYVVGIAAGSDNALHLISAGSGKLWHSVWRPGSGWGQPILAFTENQHPSFMSEPIFDSQQNLHITLNGYYGSRYWRDLSLPQGSETFQEFSIETATPVYGLKVAWGPDSKLHALIEMHNDPVYPSIAYQTLENASQALEASLSQTVVIPADMKWPTLSFMYRVYTGGKRYPNSAFQVSITPEGGQPTSVRVINGLSDWQHAWADLSPWVGKQVEVTFRMRQAAGEPYAFTSLDEVILGEWVTPHVFEVDPAPVPFPYDPHTSVMLSGANLSRVTSVSVAGRSVQADYVAETDSLRILLPPDLGVGRYDIRVENPDGTGSTTQSILEIGNSTFIPFLTR